MTRITKGFKTDEITEALIVVEKPGNSLGLVTKGIKEGGSIKGVLGYKKSDASTAFDASSGDTLIDFVWVEAGKGDEVVKEPTDTTTNTEKKPEDWASSLSLGVSFLAAASALAF